MARAMLVVLIVLVAGGLAPARSGAYRPPSEKRKDVPSAVQISSATRLEQDVLALINRERSRRGLGGLRVNGLLSAAARSHSWSMASHGYFGHQAQNGAGFARRMKASYPELPGRLWQVAENLMWASPDLSAVQTVEAWLKSPGHRRNLIGPRWRDVGIGCVRALAAPGIYVGLDVTIITVDFGVR
jgi:uncharacterized protein YkwD